MQERGASLIEVILVLGMVGVTLSFAGESFVSAAMRQHGKAVTTELAAELRAAHALAIKRRERVRVVFEPDTNKVRTELAGAPQAPLRKYDYGGRGVEPRWGGTGLTGGTQDKQEAAQADRAGSRRKNRIGKRMKTPTRAGASARETQGIRCRSDTDDHPFRYSQPVLFGLFRLSCGQRLQGKADSNDEGRREAGRPGQSPVLAHRALRKVLAGRAQ